MHTDVYASNALPPPPPYATRCTTGDAQTWAPTMSQNMTEADPNHRSYVPHIRLEGDIGNFWSGSIPPTMSIMETVDKIQAIDDLWNYSMGNKSGTFPNYVRAVSQFSLSVCLYYAPPSF